MTLSQLSDVTNRPAVCISGLQKRFGLPVFPGDGYSEAYAHLVRDLVHYRRLNISEERLLELWEDEKKLLEMIHVNTAGSRTWFLDACGAKDHLDRRLLLTHHDMGLPLDARAIQSHLDFAGRPPELFPGAAMGEDAIRQLAKCLKQREEILGSVADEIPHARAAVRRLGPLAKRNQG